MFDVCKDFTFEEGERERLDTERKRTKHVFGNNRLLTLSISRSIEDDYFDDQIKPRLVNCVYGIFCRRQADIDNSTAGPPSLS